MLQTHGILEKPDCGTGFAGETGNHREPRPPQKDWQPCKYNPPPRPHTPPSAQLAEMSHYCTVRLQMAMLESLHVTPECHMQALECHMQALECHMQALECHMQALEGHFVVILVWCYIWVWL